MSKLRIKTDRETKKVQYKFTQKLHTSIQIDTEKKSTHRVIFKQNQRQTQLNIDHRKKLEVLESIKQNPNIYKVSHIL